jgi:hypothetical protein
MTKAAAALFALLLVLLAACGDDATTTTAATTTLVSTTTTAATTTLASTTTAAPVTTTSLPGLDADGRISQAAVVRQFLFDTVTLWGEEALDLEALGDGIRSVYSIEVRGYGREADPDGISILANTIDDKSVAGPDNPRLVAFTVADTTGACLGGVVYGFPAPDTTLVVDLPQGEPCTAGAVYEMAPALIAAG